MKSNYSFCDCISAPGAFQKLTTIILMILILPFVIGENKIFGFTNSWTGGISNDWFTSANWNSGVPSAISDVEISSGAVYMPSISSSGAACKSITINSGASLLIDSAGYLSVTGFWCWCFPG